MKRVCVRMKGAPQRVPSPCEDVSYLHLDLAQTPVISKPRPWRSVPARGDPLAVLHTGWLPGSRRCSREGAHELGSDPEGTDQRRP